MTDFASIFAQPAGQGDSSHVGAAGLCLSGGGYRAMLFHVGALRRLYEAGALRALARISSVSGGSITAAVLAHRWQELLSADTEIDAFEDLVQQPLYGFAGERVDVFAVLKGIVTPGRRVSDFVAAAYRPLLGDFSLQQLPDTPRFVFLATNLGSGSVLRFAKPYTADAKVGKRDHLDLPLTRVVAASSAFPPVLGPAVVKLADNDALTETFPDPEGDELALHTQPYTHRLELGDGGIYDNLGGQPLEQYHTILASDGGSPFKNQPRTPPNWLSNTTRSWHVTDNQVRSLRKHALIDEYKSQHRNGTYWGIRSDVTDYPQALFRATQERVDDIAATPTRLWPLPVLRRKQPINWGYAICDTALRSHLDPTLAPPVLPYQDGPLA
jgi:NTE family protein